MKWINYKIIAGQRNAGTMDNPVMEDVISEKSMSYSEKNLAVVLREAYNGEYTVEDDGQPEPVVEPTPEERLEALEAAMLEMMGVAVDG